MRLIAFGLFIIASSLAFAATKYPMPLPGGYANADVTNAQVQEAANFAIQQLNAGTLVKIISAQSQVVAGVNYKMQLLIAATNGQQVTYEVIVFVPLPVTNDPMQLTSAELLQNPSQEITSSPSL